MAGRHVGHQGARRAGADLLEDEPGRAGGDRGRRAPHRGPRGRQGRRGGEVPHDPLDVGDGPRLADPRVDRADPAARAGRRSTRATRPRSPGPAPGSTRRSASTACGRSRSRRSCSTRRSATAGRATSSPSSTARSGCSTGRPGRRSPRPTAPCTATTGSSWRRTRTPSSSPGSTTRSGYPLPAITRYGIVHVTDGGTRLYEAAVTPRDWIAFRACLALHAWRRRRRRERRPAAPRRVLRGGPRRARLLDPRGGGAVVPLPAGVAVTTILAIDPGSSSPPGCSSTATGRRGSGSRPTTCSSGRCGRAGCPTSSSSRRSSPTGWRSAPRCSTRSCWAGRFAEAAHRVPVVLLPRRAVKLALCGDSRAKDANIRQALHRPLRRVGGGSAARQRPGPLYGISRDVWSALAIAVTYAIGPAAAADRAERPPRAGPTRSPPRWRSRSARPCASRRSGRALAVAPSRANVVAMKPKRGGRGGMTVRALPRSLEDLRGRRAARWIRESTAGQADNFGPDAQLEQQTRAIERWGLVDTGGGLAGRPLRADDRGDRPVGRDARRRRRGLGGPRRRLRVPLRPGPADRGQRPPRPPRPGRGDPVRRRARPLVRRGRVGALGPGGGRGRGVQPPAREADPRGLRREAPAARRPGRQQGAPRDGPRRSNDRRRRGLARHRPPRLRARVGGPAPTARSARRRASRSSTSRRC